MCYESIGQFDFPFFCENDLTLTKGVYVGASVISGGIHCGGGGGHRPEPPMWRGLPPEGRPEGGNPLGAPPVPRNWAVDAPRAASCSMSEGLVAAQLLLFAAPAEFSSLTVEDIVILLDFFFINPMLLSCKQNVQ